tara:strand:+ start:154 stop:597 length:444 start_codon:yes stop_codon:yes gene_type:complete
MCYNFKTPDLDFDIFLKAYIIRNKDSSDPKLINLKKKSDNQYILELNKKIPIFLKKLSNTEDIKYSENLYLKDNYIEISCLQTICGYIFNCNTTVKYNKEKQRLSLTTLIKIDSFPYILEPVLKSYIKKNFDSQREKEQKIINNLLE